MPAARYAYDRANGLLVMDLTPEKMVAGGEALARDADGRVVMIQGAIPGEAVRVEITTAKKSFARGRGPRGARAVGRSHRAAVPARARRVWRL